MSKKSKKEGSLLELDVEPGSIEVGMMIKVHVPGEWPWATILKIVSPKIVQARLENNLAVGSNQVGDVLTFQWRDLPAAPEMYAWELSPDREQLPYGPQLIKRTEAL